MSRRLAESAVRDVRAMTATTVTIMILEDILDFYFRLFNSTKNCPWSFLVNAKETLQLKCCRRERIFNRENVFWVLEKKRLQFDASSLIPLVENNLSLSKSWTSRTLSDLVQKMTETFDSNHLGPAQRKAQHGCGRTCARTLNVRSY